MRCPKCGYTSFDHLDTCKKCHKSLVDIVAAVNGTTYEAVAPLFLKITREIAQPSVSRPVQQLDFEEFETEELTNETLRQGIDTEFILDDQSLESDFAATENTFADPQKEIQVGLDDLQQVSPRDEFTLDLEMNSEEEMATMPPIDFGDLDISDLAPTCRNIADDALALRLTDDDTPLVQTTLSPAIKPATDSTSHHFVTASPAVSLEDLNFNGLDLESPTKVVTGSTVGKRLLPSVKTGTALDKFDIDLGELFTENKE